LRKEDFRRASTTLSRWIFGDLFFKDVFEKSGVLISDIFPEKSVLFLFIF
jgi:hypothetical protein